MIDWTQVIVAGITICVPALVTLVTSTKLRRQADRNSARQTIVTMIFEDRLRMMNDELPENYKAIMDDYDVYIANYGNSYLKEKVEEYKLKVKEYDKKH